MRNVLVTGIGVCSPVGSGAEQFWCALNAGNTGIRLADRERQRLGARAIALVGLEDQTDERHSPNSGASVSNPTFALLGRAAALAVQDSHLQERQLSPSRIGIVVSIGGIEQYTDDLLSAIREASAVGFTLHDFVQEAYRLHPLRRLRHLPNIGTFLVAKKHSLCGPSLTLTGGAASGLQAIEIAASMVRTGEVDAVLCGAADSRVSPFLLGMVRSRWPLSSCENPDVACRPFDKHGDGIVVGEGAAIIVLESEECAATGHGRTYAQYIGGCSIGPGAGRARQISMSLRQVRAMVPGSIEVVIAHGEGVPDLDLAEAAALCDVFRESAAPPLISSVQAAIGHTMSASGAFNAVAACLALSSEVVPAIRSLDNPIADLCFVTRQPIRSQLHHALAVALERDGNSTSVAFGRNW